MKLALSFCYFIVVSMRLISADSPYETDNGVYVLTNANFDNFMQKIQLYLWNFMRHAPEYEKEARNSSIPLVKADATVETELLQRFGIQGYPTLMFWHNFNGPIEYNGGRDADGEFRKYFEESGHYIKLAKVDATKEKKLVDQYDVTANPTMKESEDSKLLETLREAAELVRETFHQIGYTFDSNAMKHMKTKPNEIVIFYPKLFFTEEFESDRVIFPNNKRSATPEELLRFFRDNCTPLVGSITRSNIASRYSKHPLVIAYYDVDFSFDMEKNTQYFRNKMSFLE